MAADVEIVKIGMNLYEVRCADDEAIEFVQEYFDDYDYPVVIDRDQAFDLVAALDQTSFTYKFNL